MKQKLLIPLLLSAMITAACSKSTTSSSTTTEDNAQSATPIAFDSAKSSESWNSDTKAVMSGTTLQVGDKIGLFGYCNDEPNKDVTMFQNQVLEVGGTEDALTYTYSPIKYYPSDGTVRFFAYYPHSEQANATITVDNSTQGQPKLHYTPAGTASQQRNFLVADPISQDKDGGDVSLNLEHRMAKLIFSAAYVDESDDITSVRIKSITFIGYSGIGTFDESGDFSWASDTESSFESTASITSDELLDVNIDKYTTEEPTYTTISNSSVAATETGTMLIPPQINIGDDYPLSIKATIEVVKDGSTVVVAKLFEFKFSDYYKSDDDENHFLQELYTTNIQFKIEVSSIVSLEIGTIKCQDYTTVDLEEQIVE